jgi:hypothetical protein
MPIRQIILTKEELDEELLFLYPEIKSSRDRAQMCADALGNITARTIVGYLSGERPPATKFCADLLLLINERYPERAYKLSQATILQTTNETIDRYKNDLLFYERMVDKMCLSCAGQPVEDGGTCWDSVGCPLAAFTKFPARKGAQA